MERNILQKARGPKLKSGIEHTKPAKPTTGRGKVYPGRGNQSPIGKALPCHVDVGNAAPGIFKAKPQAHPGKATKDKSLLTFCELCGAYITSKCTLCEIFCSHTLSASKLDQHQTKTEKHKTSMQRNIRHVDCLLCGQIHPVGPCSQSRV